MIIKEFVARDTCNKNRVFVEVECECCDTIFTKQKRQLTDYACSSLCRSILKGKRVLVKCAHCGADVYKAISRVNSSRNGIFFCNKICKDEGQKYIKEIQPDHYGTADPANTYRKLAFDNQPHHCQMCGYDTNKAALVVHHIDHNRTNNSLDNLIILCANCHAIEHWGQ